MHNQKDEDSVNKAQGRPQAAVGSQVVDEARVKSEIGQNKVEAFVLIGDRELAAVKDRVQELLATPATPEQIDVVNHQLGRYPRGMVAVGARCICGNPLAVVTRPQLEDGTPFPVSYTHLTLPTTPYV